MKLQIDSKLQNKLRDQYNPEGSMLRNAQLRMLEILIFLDKICTENNIQYWLDSGTLLGAARHGGFIPWDNDIDVCMTRKEYNRFMKIMKSGKYDEYPYRLQTSSSDPGFFDYWAVLRDLNSEYIMDTRTHTRRKYRGLQVDIFPVDDNISPKLHKFASSLKARTIDRMTFRPIPNWLIYIPDFFIRNIIFPLLRNKKSKNYKNTSMYGVGIPFKHVIHQENIHPINEILFEGHIFKAPGNIDGYLTTLYGDWRKIPDPDKRIQDSHANNLKIF